MADHELDHAQRALVTIIKASKAALDVAVSDLKAEPTPTALERVQQEADVLSASIAQLARTTDDLGMLAPPPAPERVNDGGALLDAGLRACAMVENGLCDDCGGVVPGGDFVPDDE